MRRTTHHTTLALAALTLLLAGCGTQAGSGEGDGDTVSPSPSTSSSPGCTSVPELGADDSGRTVCLAAGDTVRISLDGTKSRPWKSVTAEGDILEATNSGIVLLPGDATSAFKAVSAGTAHLNSSRPLCATETGKVSCKGIQEWSVTVVVE
jgi:predicted small secreted protein